MIYDKDSMYYQLNQAELEDMERHVPMTIRERTAIRFWVRRAKSRIFSENDDTEI